MELSKLTERLWNGVECRVADGKGLKGRRFDRTGWVVGKVVMGV